MLAHPASSSTVTPVSRIASGVAVASRRAPVPNAPGAIHTRGGSYGSGGGAAAIDAASARSIASRASSSDAPSPIRPTTRQRLQMRAFDSGDAVCAAIASAPIGAITSGTDDGSRPGKVGGTTPTTAKRRPFSVSVRRVTSGSAPIARRQKPSLTTATGDQWSAPPSSPGSSVRPCCARTPSVAK